MTPVLTTRCGCSSNCADLTLDKSHHPRSGALFTSEARRAREISGLGAGLDRPADYRHMPPRRGAAARRHGASLCGCGDVPGDLRRMSLGDVSAQRGGGQARARRGGHRSCRTSMTPPVVQMGIRTTARRDHRAKEPDPRAQGNNRHFLSAVPNTNLVCELPSIRASSASRTVAHQFSRIHGGQAKGPRDLV